MLTRRQFIGWLAALVTASAYAQQPAAFSLSDLDLATVRQSWGKARSNRSVTGNPLKINSVGYTNGIGTHANSEFNLALNGKAVRLTAAVGLDDDSRDPKAVDVPSVRFVIVGDGKMLWQSPVMILDRSAKAVDLDLTGVRFLSLLVLMANDKDHWEHADWVDAKITMSDATKPEALKDLPKENEVLVTQLFLATAKKARPPVAKP